MSSYVELFQLRPLPNSTDLEDAHMIIDEGYGSGGAWPAVMEQALSVHTDRSLWQQYHSLAAVGLMYRDDAHVSGVVLDEPTPPVQAAQAFVRGFMQQIEPVQLAYSRGMSSERMLSFIIQHYDSQGFEKLKDRDEREAVEAEYVQALGQYGLELLGDGATNYVEKWAAQVYPNNTRLARIFSLGHGAMAFSASNLQRGINERVIESSRIDLDTEAQKIIFNDTGESH